MKDQIEVSTLHKELSDWKSDLDLFNIELKTFAKLLDSIKEKNTTSNVTNDIEKHMKKMHSLVMESVEMKNSIQIREHEISSKEFNALSEGNLISDDTELREDFSIFKAELHDFRKDFHNFVVQWM